MTDVTRCAAWEDSYDRRENFVFWPSDEVVRFVSRHLRRRIGLDEVIDVVAGAAGSRVVDIGCGIGRNLIFGAGIGLEMWGIDLSTKAVDKAREWLSREVGPQAAERVVAGDVRSLPWSDGFFDHAVSDSALDSMTFEIARAGVREVARVLKPGGLFYCNFISGSGIDDVKAFDGEAVVNTRHEEGTIQSYFDEEKVRQLTGTGFDVVGCAHHRVNDIVQGTHGGRWHAVLRRNRGTR